MDTPELSPAEARVLASLFEKSITTPNYYPMTVNAIMAASNQKSSRFPVMSLSEGEVGKALNTLAELRFCSREDLGSRVPKWRQNFKHRLLLKDHSAALLAMLMLRGAQTRSELRSRAETLRGPTTPEQLDEAVEFLADRSQPLIVTLPRQPGQKEARLAHTLCGEPDVTEVAAPAPARSSTSRDELLARIESLEARVQALESGD
ncbi:DUF480 domain-containing protein [Abyssibacter sp.]|uniref:YceH family protein n=1 Tax=Abyssibacter sp. TaxID=2320200 RepID=UPI0025BA50D6|nr:DUF480 domain-containing protein [Abyssibacter sp.]MCK5859653.1 DUF480 domain-containing protein [Abyssibacter sp.]